MDTLPNYTHAARFEGPLTHDQADAVQRQLAQLTNLSRPHFEEVLLVHVNIAEEHVIALLILGRFLDALNLAWVIEGLLRALAAGVTYSL
jgi:hypothetical protein